ncbi:MAG: hypothetical protein R3E48_18665 [Burkholderiaceae bacterium]
MSRAKFTFHSTSTVGPESLLEAIGSNSAMRSPWRDEITVERTFYDTFDRRLHEGRLGAGRMFLVRQCRFSNTVADGPQSRHRARGDFDRLRRRPAGRQAS